MVLKCALGHSDVSVSQRYLEVNASAVRRGHCPLRLYPPAQEGSSRANPRPIATARPQPINPAPEPIPSDSQLLLFPDSTDAAA